METKIRAFLAIELDREIQKNILHCIEKELISFTNIHFIKPENLHFTLQFLGNINKQILPELYDACTDTALLFKSFEISLETVGVFPNERSPRILWIGLHDEKYNLKNLSNIINEKTSHFPIKKEDRECTPHLTIGRIKVLKNIPALIDKLKKIELISFGTQTISSFSLFQSMLTNTGPIYTKLKRFDLK